MLKSEFQLIRIVAHRLNKHNLKTKNDKEMKLKSIIVLIFSLFLSTSILMAQKISDASYRAIGYIKSDGTIQDGSYRTIGYIKSDGSVLDGNYKKIAILKTDGSIQNASYSTIGKIKNDGTVTDAAYSVIGYVKTDGKVLDKNYKAIGYTENVPAAHAALFFFFF